MKNPPCSAEAELRNAMCGGQTKKIRNTLFFFKDYKGSLRMLSTKATISSSKCPGASVTAATTTSVAATTSKWSGSTRASRKSSGASGLRERIRGQIQRRKSARSMKKQVQGLQPMKRISFPRKWGLKIWSWKKLLSPRLRRNNTCSTLWEAPHFLLSFELVFSCALISMSISFDFFPKNISYFSVIL